MEPTLVEGDRLLVVRTGKVRPGQIVAVRDPRNSDRILVKRCVASGLAGVTLRGDNVAASTDSRHFGPVHPTAVLGRVCYRYHPRQRSGPVASGGLPSEQ
jgi:nickel-type superoxide dismutase maturation protease